MHTHDISGPSSGAFYRVRSRIATPGVTFSAVSRRAADEEARGGDVFEAIVHPSGALSVLVADISSKGAPSAGHADVLRRAFRRSAYQANSPSRILAVLDRLRFETPPDSLGVVFAAAFVANVDPALPRLFYASAGHGSALVVAGRTHRHLDATGPLLGAVNNANYLECSEPFGRGALLVVATNGFSECRNTALDSMHFGTAGIIRALAFDKLRSSRSVAQIVARSADIFTGGHYHDDATVAVIARSAS